MKIVADANIPFVGECFSSVGEVEVFGGRRITADVLADADVLLVRSITPVNADLLAASKVRFVATATIGVDHVDIDYLQGRGIGFASAPGSNANSAAEYVVAGLLEVGAKRGIELAGKSIGIIGVGNVGSRVASKCAALGMEVRLNDPPLARESPDAKYVGIEELFGCDFITLHTPLTLEGRDRTYHLADERFFRSLKKGCVFVNASRGGVADSGALKSAIGAGRLGAAVLDVWEGEPEIDAELLKMVDIGTPHIAGYSLDGKIAGMIMIYEAACEYFGVEAKYGVGDFLPAPAVGELRAGAEAKPDEETIRDAVRAVYDIMGDDARLRALPDVSREEAGAFFDNLRKEYPVRREFGNTRVILEGASESVGCKFAGIGFEIES